MSREQRTPNRRASALALGAAVAFLLAGIISGGGALMRGSAHWQTSSAVGFGLAAVLWFIVFLKWSRSGR